MENTTYTIHAHNVRRDGSKDSFWTLTGLTKREAESMARDQRAESGGVARIVREGR
jgi:hypothetical protein